MNDAPLSPTPDRAFERGRDVVHRGHFLEMHTIHYTDPYGRERRWESAERVGRQGAVWIVPRLFPDNAWVLVRQYRPPAGGPVIEFPAGLLDDGESPEDGALRELAEETGYHGTVRTSYPAAYSSPGLSGEAVHLVWVDIDGTRPENRVPRACPDAGECLDVIRVDFSSGVDFLRARFAAGERFDAKVVAYLSAWNREHAGPPR